MSNKKRKNGRDAEVVEHVCPPDHYLVAAPRSEGSTCELSVLELREAYAKEFGGDTHWAFEGPALRWTGEAIRGQLVTGLQHFRLQTGPASVHLGEKARDGGRHGMILALEAAHAFLTQNLPIRDLDALAPLARLLEVLKDLENGITDRALKAAGSGGNKDPRIVIEFKARCLLASEVLQIHGLERKAADRVVVEKIRLAARLADIKLGNPRKGAPEEEALEHWRRHQRRDARARSWQSRHWPNGLYARVILLREELNSRMRSAVSVQHLLDMILDPILPKDLA